MGFFGGLGAGKGWLKFLFLVEPDVLRDVLLSEKPVFVKNGRLDVDDPIPLDQYVATYARYIEAMLDSHEPTWQITTPLYVGLASSVDLFAPEACPDSASVLLSSTEPVVNFAPLNLYYDEPKGQLCTNVDSKLFFGIEMSYPRVFFSREDGFEIPHQTEGLANQRMFDALRSSLKKATKACKIRSSSREHRPPIRISAEMQDRMKRHPALIAAGLELV